MKYIVSVTQHIKYTDTITGTFASLTKAQEFIEMVMEHFDRVGISIDVETEDQEAAE